MRIARRKLIFIAVGILIFIGILLIGERNYTVKTLKFENIGRGQVFTYKGNIVIKNEAKFRRLWKEWYNVEEYPKVDFSKEMVVGVFMGVCSTGGYYIEIKRIEKRIGRIVIYVKKRMPDPDEGMTSQIITAPARIVKTERSVLPVIFSYSPSVGERVEKWILRKYGPMIKHFDYSRR